MQSNTSQKVPRSKIVSLYREAMAKGLPVDDVDQVIQKWHNRQTVTEQVETNADENREYNLKHQIPAIIRYGALLVPFSFIAIGIFLVGNAVVPLAQYYFESTVPTAQAKMISPVPDNAVVTVATETAAPTSLADSSISLGSGPQIIDEDLDYTNLANWFAGAVPDQLAADGATEDTYIIDIPSLDIKEAEVTLGGTDLDESLIQYPGTAEPGDSGSPVIFGHSVLRQFYNPSLKNPRRYVSIFSTIMTMEPGEEIFVTHEGVRYRYLVESKTEVQPEDVYILTQEYDARRLKLVTCTPEGTYLRRGVVTAVLEADV